MTVPKNFLGETLIIPQPGDRKWGNAVNRYVTESIDVHEGVLTATKSKTRRLERPAQVLTVTGSATTIDFSLGSNIKLKLQINTTLTLINPGDGGNYFFHLKQDAVGSRTITWPSSIKWLHGGTAPVLTTTPNFRDVVALHFDGEEGIYVGEFGLNAAS